MALNISALDIPEIFGNDMILQRNTQCKIWGWAEANHYVRIVTGWDNHCYQVKAGSDGAWKVEVKTPEASYNTYDITFTEYRSDPEKKAKSNDSHLHSYN